MRSPYIQCHVNTTLHSARAFGPGGSPAAPRARVVRRLRSGFSPTSSLGTVCASRSSWLQRPSGRAGITIGDPTWNRATCRTRRSARRRNGRTPPLPLVMPPACATIALLHFMSRIPAAVFVQRAVGSATGVVALAATLHGSVCSLEARRTFRKVDRRRCRKHTACAFLARRGMRQSLPNSCANRGAGATLSPSDQASTSADPRYCGASA